MGIDQYLNLNDYTTSGSLGALNAAVSFTTLNDISCVAFNITGTYNLTFVAEGNVDGSTWLTLPMAVYTSGGSWQVVTSLAGTNSSQLGYIACAGMQGVRIRASVYTSGTATVNLRASSAPSALSVIGIGNAALGAGSNVIGAVTQSAGPWSQNITQIGSSAIATAASGIQKVGLTDGSGNAITSTASALDVNIKSGGGSGFSVADESAWTAGTSAMVPAGAVFNDAAAALTAGQEGALRATSNRALHVNLRNSSATEIATSSNPLRVDPTGTTTQPVSGTVTANVGTTNGLALDATLTGGNAQTKITDGTNVASVVAGDSGQNGLVVAGQRKEVSFSTTTAQAVGSTDASDYKTVSVHITSQGTSSSVTFQTSNDNVNWISTNLLNLNNTSGAPTNSSGASGVMFVGPVPGRYFRLNVTGITAGTTAGVIEFYSESVAPWTMQIIAVGSVGAQSADTGSPVKTGGKFNTTPPTLTTGQRGDTQLDALGNTRMVIMDAAGNVRGANVTAAGALQVDGSAVTQPVSGTVTANAGTGNFATNVAQVSGSAVATAAAGIMKVGLTDGTGTAITSTASALDVNIKSGGGSGFSVADETAWTAGTSAMVPAGAVFNDTATALTAGQEGTLRATNNRALHVNLRNSSATEIATSSNPLRVDPTGTTTQPVSMTNSPFLAGGSAVTIASQPVDMIGLRNTAGNASVMSGVSDSADGVATNSQGNSLRVASFGFAWNGTTWDRIPGSAAGGLKVDGSGVTQPVSGTVTANAGTGNFGVNLTQVAGSSVATAATGIAKVGLTDGAGTSVTVGQKTMASSLPVAIASDQSTLTVSPSAGGSTGTITSAASVVTSASFSGVAMASVSVHGTYAGVSFTISISDDGGTTFYNPPIYSVVGNKWSAPGATLSPGTNASAMYLVPLASGTGIQIKITASAWTSGTANIRIQANAQSPQTVISQATLWDAAGNSRGANITAANALQVDGSAVTQPVSGTVTANAGTGNFATNLAQVNGSTVATAASGIQKVGLADGTGNALSSTAGSLNVNITGGGSSGGGTSATDEAAWTAGTSSFTPSGGVFNDSATALTSGQQGTFRVTNNRGLHVNLRTATGTEIGTSGSPVRVDPTGTTTQPVSGTVTVSPPSDTTTSGSLGALNAVVGIGPVNGLSSVGIDIQGTWTGTITFQGSLDNSTWRNITAVSYPQASGGTNSNVTSLNGFFLAPIAGFEYFQVKMTSYTSGTANILLRASGVSYPLSTDNAPVNIVSIGGNTVSAPAAGIMRVAMTDGSGNNITSTSGAMNVSVIPGGSGWSSVVKAGQSTTVATVSSAAGEFGGYFVYNPNSSVAYLQVFDTTGTVTLGTTVPIASFGIPATSGANLEITNGLTIANGIKIACTTTAEGSAAPTTGLDCTIFYH